MKKIILTLATISMILFGTTSTIYAKEDAESQNSKTSIEQEWDDLQNTITESLETVDGYYVCDHTYIKDLVTNFNVEEFNDFYKLDYTRNTLYNQIIENIENTPVSTMPYGNYCGYEGRDDGWNYNRYLHDRSMTDAWTEQLDNQADMLTIAGKVATFFSKCSW